MSQSWLNDVMEYKNIVSFPSRVSKAIPFLHRSRTTWDYSAKIKHRREGETGRRRRERQKEGYIACNFLLVVLRVRRRRARLSFQPWGRGSNGRESTLSVFESEGTQGVQIAFLPFKKIKLSYFCTKKRESKVFKNRHVELCRVSFFFKFVLNIRLVLLVFS